MKQCTKYMGVIRITDEAHRALRTYCEEHCYVMGAWLSKLIIDITKEEEEK